MNKLGFAILTFACIAIANAQRGYRGKSRSNFNLMNDFRASEGVAPLCWNPRLYPLALAWSTRMYNESRLYHSDYNLGENVAYAAYLYTPKTVAEGFFTQWKESPGHRENMLRTFYECGAVAIYGDGTTFYGTQLFDSNCGRTVSRSSFDQKLARASIHMSSSKFQTKEIPTAH